MPVPYYVFQFGSSKKQIPRWKEIYWEKHMCWIEEEGAVMKGGAKVPCKCYTCQQRKGWRFCVEELQTEILRNTQCKQKVSH
jgi:uncharacterized membrane protein (UPF0127 family)